VSSLSTLSSLLLRSPLLWGAGLAFFFFSLIHGGVITDENVVRYLAGHWVEYIEVGLFCVGLSSLAMKLLDLLRQRRELATPLLAPTPAGGQHPTEAATLQRQVADEVGEEPTAYLPRRLREALDLVVRTGTADDLEDHLKYLADLDAARAHASYGLVRFVVWAIPIMGFLGTVIGITVAIANLSPTQLENISGVVAGLGTAFDTTATALALSMLLMFLQFVIERSEQSLLDRVDQQAWETLAGRFQTDGITDGSALAMARLGDAVGRSSAQLIEAQASSWRELEQTAAGSLERVFAGMGDRLRETLAASLDETLATWRESLVDAHRQLAAERDDRWERATAALGEAVTTLEQHQEKITGQTATLEKVVGMLDEIAALEQSLENNLAAVTASGRFEEAVISLSAATQLLAARTRDVAVGQRELAVDTPVGKVA
jgi:biopolymer transport protein ExbB/TolQ